MGPLRPQRDDAGPGLQPAPVDRAARPCGAAFRGDGRPIEAAASAGEHWSNAQPGADLSHAAGSAGNRLRPGFGHRQGGRRQRPRRCARSPARPASTTRPSTGRSTTARWRSRTLAANPPPTGGRCLTRRAAPSDPERSTGRGTGARSRRSAERELTACRVTPALDVERRPRRRATAPEAAPELDLGDVVATRGSSCDENGASAARTRRPDAVHRRGAWPGSARRLGTPSSDRWHPSRRTPPGASSSSRSSSDGQRIVAAPVAPCASLREVAESPAFLDPNAKPRNSRVFLDGIPTSPRADDLYLARDRGCLRENPARPLRPRAGRAGGGRARLPDPPDLRPRRAVIGQIIRRWRRGFAV